MLINVLNYMTKVFQRTRLSSAEISRKKNVTITDGQTVSQTDSGEVISVCQPGYAEDTRSKAKLIFCLIADLNI